jgi:hypothetical protein
VAALTPTLALPADQRLAAQAEILRRIARTLHGEAAARLTGEPWLAALDGMFATRFFTTGPGRAFADLYVPRPAGDAEAASAELPGLMQRLRT